MTGHCSEESGVYDALQTLVSAATCDVWRCTYLTTLHSHLVFFTHERVRELDEWVDRLKKIVVKWLGWHFQKDREILKT